VFVADWYDTGVGGHAFGDPTTGRISRVAPQGNKPRSVKAYFAIIKGLIAALKSPNLATVDAARRAILATFVTAQPVAFTGGQAACPPGELKTPRLRGQYQVCKAGAWNSGWVGTGETFVDRDRQDH